MNIEKRGVHTSVRTAVQKQNTKSAEAENIERIMDLAVEPTIVSNFHQK